MPAWLTDEEYRVAEAACECLMPAGDQGPGARAAGVAEYIDRLLGAFTFDPPRIWAGGPTSGRAGGPDGFTVFHHLSPLDELAWRTRIEGSRDLPAREFNGPVVGYQERYRTGLARLGADFCDVDEAEQVARLRADPGFVDLLFAHACEGMYGAPEYGGNRGLVAWTAIGFEGDVQPRGWTDEEVTRP